MTKRQFVIAVQIQYTNSQAWDTWLHRNPQTKILFKQQKCTKMSAKGKVVIVTGCNSGIGKETVRGLAKEGAKVYMACRDMKKCEEARDEITAQTKSGSIHCRQCDLADFDSIRKFVTDFMEEEEKLDVLINNGGVMWGDRKVTKQGIEMQLGVNHIGHFLLTQLLLDTLKKSAPSRIVVVASAAHTRGKIKFEDLNSEKSYSAMGCYEQSKLANVLFAKELAQRLHGTGVVVNCLHPGVVSTEIARSAGWLNNFAGKFFMNTFLKTPAQGAATTLHLALSPELEGVTGNYFSDCKPTPTAKQGNDMVAAERLWAATEEIIQSKK